MTTEQITELTAIRDLLLEGQPENRTIAAQRLTALLDSAPKPDGSHLIGWMTRRGLTAIKVKETDPDGVHAIELSDGDYWWYNPDGKFWRYDGVYSVPDELDLFPPAAAQ